MNPAAAPVAPWLAAVADTLDEALWIWLPADGQVVHANAAFRRDYGQPAAQGLPGPEVLLAQVHPQDAPRLRLARRGLPAQGYTEEYRLLLPTPGGAPRLVQVQERALATQGPHGEPQVTHVLRDLSWQLDTNAQLRAEIDRRTDAERSRDDATQRLEALIATADDAVVSIDEASHIVDWNGAAERMFGWSRDEAVGQVLTRLIVPTVHHGHHHSGIERYLREGSSRLFGRRVETRALRRNGEEFHVELSVWPVRTGHSHTFSSFIRDISHRKAAERALAESEAKYRKVVENVSEGILVTAAGRILYANPRRWRSPGWTRRRRCPGPSSSSSTRTTASACWATTCAGCAARRWRTTTSSA